MNNRSFYYVMFILYIVLCHLPYAIPALNKVTPWFGPFPFTVWYVLLVTIFGCIMLYLAYKNVWSKKVDE